MASSALFSVMRLPLMVLGFGMSDVPSTDLDLGLLIPSLYEAASHLLSGVFAKPN